VFDLIVNGLDKAQLHEGSEFSIFVGLGLKQMEAEQSGGVTLARNTKTGVDDAVEARASKSDDEKSADNPRDGSSRSPSRVEESGEDVVGKVKTMEEDDGTGMFTPRTTRPERLCEPSPTSPTTQAYHIRTWARAKAIETGAMCSDATRMMKKVDDEMKMAKASGGRKSVISKEGRLRPSPVGGRRGMVEENSQAVVVSSRQDERVGSLSGNNLSDGAVRNCNRLYWINNEHSEAVRIWTIRKELGFTFSGEEEMVVGRIQAMEFRDKTGVRKESVSRVENSLSDDEGN